MKIVDAVTAVLMHEGALLITRRQPALAAFGGFWAFPGGKVDGDDHQAVCSRALQALVPATAAPLLCALARELMEELGIDLNALADAGAIAAVTDLGTALTPPISPLRYNTHFFRIDLRSRPALSVDARETETAEWVPPAELMQRYARGELLLAPPTLATLRALAADPACRHIEGLDHANREGNGLRLLEPLAGVRQLFVRSHTLPPAQHTNAYLLGDAQSHRILVDPSPASDEEMERLIEIAAAIGVHEVFITHHHPDHWERADRVAERLGATVGMSADTRKRIRGKHPQAFPEVEIHEYREGDVVCRWQGQPVHILEVPGHDAGQLALMPESKAWCLVGDLIQGIGTVVIPEEEGDMRAYFASLERIIALDPKVLLPSHGNALGGTYRLVETLKHRRQREQQILALHREGQDVDGMLPQIYVGLDPALLPLARINIRMHLRKLADDGLLAA